MSIFSYCTQAYNPVDRDEAGLLLLTSLTHFNKIVEVNHPHSPPARTQLLILVISLQEVFVEPLKKDPWPKDFADRPHAPGSMLT